MAKDDPISRQAAIDAIDKNRQALLSIGMDGAEHILVHYGRRVIEELPTIDSVKHGKWEKISDRNYKCSCCNAWWSVDRDSTIKDFKHCPDCGARLEASDETN